MGDYREPPDEEHELREAREVLQIMKKQALYTMWLVYVPNPGEAVLRKLAEEKSNKYEDEPRWHDFLHPSLRKMAVNLESFLNGGPVLYVLEDDELKP